MGFDYSAALIMGAAHELGLAEIACSITQELYELINETALPLEPLPDRGIGLCKHKEFIFVYGELWFGQEKQVEGLDQERFYSLLQKLSSECALFYWLVEETSGALEFAYFVRGEQRRHWGSCEGKVMLCEGHPLDTEPEGKFVEEFSGEQAHEIDVWDVVSIAEGFGLKWDELANVPCAVYIPKHSK